MNKILMTLMLGLGLILVGLGTGCMTTPAEPLTTIISLETSGGAKAYVQSPKDTRLGSLSFDAQSGAITVTDFDTSASDPTAAFAGVLAAQGEIQLEQSRQVTELLRVLSGRVLPE